MNTFLAKYWKKIGLVIIGLFLTVSPVFFMFFAGILVGHFFTSRFDYRMSVKLRPKRRKLVEMSESEIEAEGLGVEKKKTAVATKAFEHTEEEETNPT